MQILSSSVFCLRWQRNLHSELQIHDYYAFFFTLQVFLVQKRNINWPAEVHKHTLTHAAHVGGVWRCSDLGYKWEEWLTNDREHQLCRPAQRQVQSEAVRFSLVNPSVSRGEEAARSGCHVTHCAGVKWRAANPELHTWGPTGSWECQWAAVSVWQCVWPLIPDARGRTK